MNGGVRVPKIQFSTSNECCVVHRLSNELLKAYSDVNL